MKKAIIPALALTAFGAPTLAHAQAASDGIVTADATIPYETTFLGEEPVRFGVLDPGTDATINFGNAGQGHIGVQFNYKSVVTFSNAGPLTQRDNANAVVVDGRTITPTYYCRVLNDDGQRTSPSGTTVLVEATVAKESYTCFTGNQMTLDLAKNASNQSVRTNRWILIGGKILGTDTEMLPAGTYTGQVQITIAQSGS